MLAVCLKTRAVADLTICACVPLHFRESFFNADELVDRLVQIALSSVASLPTRASLIGKLQTAASSASAMSATHIQ